MSKLGKAVIGFVSLSCGLIAVVIIRTNGAKDDGHGLQVTPSTQTMQASYGAGDVFADYAVLNTSRELVELGKAESSCGCTVASIEPRAIAPGGTATIKLKGHPPDHGERKVTVRIPTSSKATPIISVDFTMITSRTIPYIVQKPEPLNFGAVDREFKDIEFRIVTLEHADSKSWLRSVSSSLNGLTVEKTSLRDLPQANGLVSRLYDYKARIHQLPDIGEFRGDVIFFSSIDEASPEPVLTVPVLGEVLSPISVTPSHLYASLNSAGSYSELSAIISTPAESSTELAFKPTPDSDKRFTVTITSINKNKFKLQVKPVAGHDRSISTTIELGTNHPTQTVVRVPIFIKGVD